MKNPKEIITDLIHSGEIAFIISQVFNYFCRPVKSVVRYSGSFRNPNIEGAFAAAAGILFLIQLDNYIAKKQLKTHTIFCCIGLLLALDRVIRSNSRTAYIAIAASVLCFVLHNIYYMRRNNTFLSFVGIAFICMALLVPVCKLNDWLLSNLSAYMGTEIKYPRDQDYLTAENIWQQKDYVFAAENANTNLEGRRELNTLLSSGSFQNALEAYSSGRPLYYLAYIRQMNLFGHKYHAKSWGDYIYPHNGILEIMYRYGIFAGIPYCTMLFYTLWYSFLYARREYASGEYKLYPLLVTVGAEVIFMFENGEKPFVWMIWFLFYIGMGSLFPTGDLKLDGRKTNG